ncbi:MAG: KamA family radical SAM protein [Nitrospirae bacterium]|nr:KamA family radical SAM protein [Nitrospirota bacterium]
MSVLSMPQNEALAGIGEVVTRYPALITPYYASLIDHDDPACPIRLQCVPDVRELDEMPGYVDDPLFDTAHNPAPRITHRYRDRLLLHVTPKCAVRCRFCFRKSLIGNSGGIFDGSMDAALDYIAGASGVREVILSGGDPLMASDEELSELFDRLSRIPHVERLRVHTRMPVVQPSRITERLARILASGSRTNGSAARTRVVTHFNHPREITVESVAACELLIGSGVRVLNQSVLLRGVNDNPHALVKLFTSLHRGGIQPYYLHHPDPARGTAHFRLAPADGLALFEAARRMVPSGSLPRYVIDIPGAPTKTPVEGYLGSE